MKTKSIFVFVFLVLLGVSAAFGSGQREPLERRYGPMGHHHEDFEDQETISVTGPIYFKDRMHPEIESGGKEYELLLPRFYYRDVELEEGQSISVEGYEAEGMWCEDEHDEDEVHLWVTKATIGDEEFDLSRGGYGPMGGPMHGHMRGGRGRSRGRGGMMHNRGRGPRGRS